MAFYLVFMCGRLYMVFLNAMINNPFVIKMKIVYNLM